MNVLRLDGSGSAADETDDAAAVVLAVLLAARHRSSAGSGPHVRSVWGSPTHPGRRPPAPGPAGWWASGLPS